VWLIIEAIVWAFFGLIKALLSLVNLPSLNEGVLGDLYTLIGYISTSAYNLVYLALPKGSVMTFFSMLVIVMAATHIYHFVMWVVRKLPFGMK
jgi:hypothetical protein